MDEPFELYAIRLGHVDRSAADNFLSAPRPEGQMRLDFDMWVARNRKRIVAVDAGFSPGPGARRGRQLERSPAQAVHELGIDPLDVSDLVITHLHYDHAGNLGDFPNARIWVQRAEVAYVTSGSMRHAALNRFFDADDVSDLLHESFGGRVEQVDGQAKVVDGMELHLIGGHTPGLQIVRVLTRRGWVVVASDALHYYANLERRNPFPSIVSMPQVMDGFDRILGLVPSPDHIVPGHDPLVIARYAGGEESLPDGVVALHQTPSRG